MSPMRPGASVGHTTPVRPVGHSPSALALLWVTAVLLGACGSSRPIESAPTTTLPPIVDVGLEGSLLDGVTAARVSRTIDDSFRARVLEVDPTLVSFAGAAEAYDATMLAAIAAEKERSDAPGHIAYQLANVSVIGERCTTFASCHNLAQRFRDIDYDGRSGSIEFLDNGDIGEAVFEQVRYDRSGRLRIEREVRLLADELVAPPPPPDPRFGRRADGVLRIGMLLPVNGPEPDLARAAQAGVRLAVDEINAEGGVLGSPVELLADDGGDGSPEATKAAVARLIERATDVVIGGTTFAIDAVAIGPLVDAGVVVISPTDRNRGLSAIPDRGLFWRTVSSEDAEARALAALPVDDGYLSIALVSPTAGPEAELATDVTAQLSARDASVVIGAIFDPGGDAATTARQVIDSGAEAVVVVLPTTDAAAVIRALAAAGRPPIDLPTYITSANVGPSLVEAVGAG